MILYQDPNNSALVIKQMTEKVLSIDDRRLQNIMVALLRDLNSNVVCVNYYNYNADLFNNKCFLFEAFYLINKNNWLEKI